MPNPICVVISAGQSRNPEKRGLEAAVAEGATTIPGVTVLRIPHIYDLKKDGQTYETLRSVEGEIVFISWLFGRATHWTLDRNGVRGQFGEVELLADQPDEDEEEAVSDEEEESRVTDQQPRPERAIYCIEFNASKNADDFVSEVRRIAALTGALRTGRTSTLSLENFVAPGNDTYVGAMTADETTPNTQEAGGADGNSLDTVPRIAGQTPVQSIEEVAGRRWYPVIDFSRCTNCMECIDFCLFGVYGIDSLETINVEQPDNCRKGCPACSRVCPANAIIFPQHKTPAIAGAPVDSGGLKIDLSKLFGAPETEEDPAAVAARERDEQLILAGRKPVAGNLIAERLEQSKPTRGSQPDELDSLVDELDALDL
ncbi:MAG TPA: ferredoxin family protein [Planctomycetaceae bacterium]|nr:ferredoxin family protein [Planctomycetaceae bacterium]